MIWFSLEDAPKSLEISEIFALRAIYWRKLSKIQFLLLKNRMFLFCLDQNRTNFFNFSWLFQEWIRIRIRLKSDSDSAKLDSDSDSIRPKNRIRSIPVRECGVEKNFDPHVGRDRPGRVFKLAGAGGAGPVFDFLPGRGPGISKLAGAGGRAGYLKIIKYSDFTSTFTSSHTIFFEAFTSKIGCIVRHEISWKCCHVIIWKATNADQWHKNETYWRDSIINVQDMRLIDRFIKRLQTDVTRYSTRFELRHSHFVQDPIFKCRSFSVHYVLNMLLAINSEKWAGLKSRNQSKKIRCRSIAYKYKKEIMAVYRGVAYEIGKGGGPTFQKFFEIRGDPFVRNFWKIFCVENRKRYGGPFWKWREAPKILNFDKVFHQFFIRKGSPLSFFLLARGGPPGPKSARGGAWAPPCITHATPLAVYQRANNFKG